VVEEGVVVVAAVMEEGHTGVSSWSKAVEEKDRSRVLLHE
jgi:hypothetical protein